MKTTFRTVKQLRPEELDELREILLYSDEDYFYDSIEEISNRVLYTVFANRLFTSQQFICNRKRRESVLTKVVALIA